MIIDEKIGRLMQNLSKHGVKILEDAKDT